MNLLHLGTCELLQAMTISTTTDKGGRNAPGINPGMAAIIRVLGELTDAPLAGFLSKSEREFGSSADLLAGPGGGLGQLMSFSNNG